MDDATIGATQLDFNEKLVPGRRRGRKRREVPVACSVTDCKKQATSKGMCGVHYCRWHRTGQTGLLRNVGTLEERFHRSYFIDLETGCWEWTGWVNTKGYAAITLGQHKKLRASRVSYELHKGSIPDGLLACHRCDNPRCVNPEHLFLGTTSDNARDMLWKGRAPNAKLFPSDVIFIRKLMASGQSSIKELAKRYGASESVIRSAVAGRTWAPIGE